MPPISQSQGSRGGLITAMVIFAILFLTSAIFAIYFNVNLRAEQVNNEKILTKYKKVIADQQLIAESDVAAAVSALSTDPELGDQNKKWVDVLLRRGDRLATLLSGSGNVAGLAAEADANTRIAAANEKLRGVESLKGVQIDTAGNLLSSMETLVNTLVAKDRATQDLITKTKAELASNMTAVTNSKHTIDELQKGLAEAQARADKATADAQADRAAKQGQADAMTADVTKTAADLNAAVQAKQVELNAALARTAVLEKQIDSLKNRLGRYRLDTVETTVRRADGVIRQITGGNTVYINLGQGDGVVNGMTFEVYDKAEGVPALGSDGLRDEDMPIGKGSIEIVRVGAATSECRVVKTTPGSAIAEGDLIANLVYDPNVKFNFVVYGKFDLDRNGIATDADTDVMKRLVTQWGGKIGDVINVDTDFVVLGKEPVLPVFTKEELDLPENAKKLTDAQTEADAYQKLKADARELHIPVMNQNRFLFFVGYYDQSKR